MLEVVIDTVSLQHAIRRPKKSNKQLNILLDLRICDGHIRIALDRHGALLHEYRNTCGEEIVEVLTNKWESRNGITVIKDMPKIPFSTRRKLLQLGFRDTIDKLVVALATATQDKIAVSDDPDFWDPRCTRKKGNSKACVASLCLDDLAVTVMLLAGLLARTK